jgi:SAM-dependent methyltransferase
MIGQATARLESFPRRWIQNVWGHADIDMRQKWWALWPHLVALPSSRLDVLDAGCGAGRWVFELAERRPAWSIVGIDRDPGAIRVAEATRRRLGFDNISFVQAEYFEFNGGNRFDVVLVVASAHYLAELGAAERLFQTYASWLKPGGRLIFTDTRWEGASPFFSLLPHPSTYHNVFSCDELSHACYQAGLTVELLSGQIGPLGIAAKQLGWATNTRPCPGRQKPSPIRALHPALYPARLGLAWVDSRKKFRPDELTLMWFLIARASSNGPADLPSASQCY